VGPIWRQKKQGCDKCPKPPKSSDTGRPHEGHPSLGGRCWPRVERNLPFLARKHEVRTYPDGSRAVVCGDLEALKVWYRGLSRG